MFTGAGAGDVSPVSARNPLAPENGSPGEPRWRFEPATSWSTKTCLATARWRGTKRSRLSAQFAVLVPTRETNDDSMIVSDSHRDPRQGSQRRVPCLCWLSRVSDSQEAGTSSVGLENRNIRLVSLALRAYIGRVAIHEPPRLPHDHRRRRAAAVAPAGRAGGRGNEQNGGSEIRPQPGLRPPDVLPSGGRRGGHGRGVRAPSQCPAIGASPATVLASSRLHSSTTSLRAAS